MNRKMKWGLAGVIVLALVAALLFWRDNKEDKPSFAPVVVKRADLKTSILATGTVSPENRLEIKPPIAGRAEQVLVDEGQKVKKGQVLAWMSSTERAALLDAARSEGAAELKRWEELYRPTPVVAPISGTIIARQVESGQTFQATDAILVMSDRLTVKAQVDETDIAQIKLKQKAEIVLDAYPDKKIPASVDQIAYDAKTVNNVTTYEVDVLPDETPDFMRSGMTANVSFVAASKDQVLVLPADAINTKGDHTFVYVEGPSGKPVRQKVSTGLSDGKQTEITEGLSENQVVLTPVYNPQEKGGSAGGSPFSPFSHRRKGH